MAEEEEITAIGGGEGDLLLLLFVEKEMMAFEEDFGAPLTSPASTTDVLRALLATPRQADGGCVVIITMMMIPRALLAGLVDGPCALLATP